MRRAGWKGREVVMTRRLIIVVIVISFAAGVCRAQENEAVSRAKAYEPLIIEAAIKHSVDPRLLWTVAYLETKFQPTAVSPVGARGLMQFMPATARRYGLHNPFDPAQAIDAAARYLRDLQEMFNSRLELLLAAYNAGEGAVEAFRNGRNLLFNGKIINPRGIKSAIPPYRETVIYVRNGVSVFKQLTEAGYFSGPHLARLRTIVAPVDEKAIVVTVDLEEMPEDVKRSSVYADDEPSKPIDDTLPQSSTTGSIYSKSN
jgi:transglycosylase-like protein with SLT domain